MPVHIDSFTFLNGFFAACSRDQFIEFFYINPVADKRASEFVPIGDPQRLREALDHAATWNERGYGVYFGVCPRIRDLTDPDKVTRGSEGDVDTLVAFWTELDSVKEGRAVQDDLMALQGSETPPSLCVLSGGGVHAYWLLDKPYTMPAEQRADLKATIKGLGKTVGGDPTVAEFARILRIPGFVNTKPGRDSSPVQAVAPAQKRRYALANLLKFKPPEPRPPIVYRPPVNPSDQDIVDLAQRALNAIDPGRRDSYGDWVEIGMSLSELGSIGLSLWESWSAGSSKYKAGECVRKWNTFKPRQGHTIGYLFWCADQDGGHGWRPVREMPRYAEKIQIIETVQAEDVEYPNGLPVAVRGAINAYAPAAVAPLLELIVEATAQGIIPRGSPISVDCLKYAAIRTGRALSVHTINAGLKAATDPHQVELFRILSHIKNNTISIEVGNTDPSDKILNNPCRCPGRPAILYDLLPWSTILTNIARAAVAPILQEVFPADNPLVAPIRAECLAGLGRDDIDTLADELDARYGTLVAAQPGYKKAINRANAKFHALEKALANPQAAPIPAGWTYRNSSEYLSCCERAIIEAAGGETQYGRRKNAALIGCTERNLPAVYKGAGVKVEKDQLVDVVITAPDQLKLSIDNHWHDDLQGYAIAFASSKSKHVKPIDDPEALAWAFGQIEVGAVVSVRYRQANKQTIVTEGQPRKEKPALKAEPEAVEKAEPQPRLLEVEAPALPTVAARYARQMRLKLLILWYAEHRHLNWAEANVGKLVSLASPIKVEGAKAVDTSTGEMGLFDAQLSLDMLLNQPERIVPIPVQPLPETVVFDPMSDPVLRWLVDECGGTITNVVETGSAFTQPASLEMEEQWTSLSQSSPLAIGQSQPRTPLPRAS